MVIKIAVAGAGLAGKQHISALRRGRSVALAAVIDPGENGIRAAERENVPHFDSLAEMLKSIRPDGVVIATPTSLHSQGAAFCAQEQLPMLIEKPIAADSASAAQMIKTAAKTPLLVGHHRRHNPLTIKAREIIASGALGRLTAIHAQCWLYKPDDYFAADWRRAKGAGPLFINAVHDIDILRHLCGDITSVRALESNGARGFAAEDTAVLIARLQNGALATINISDAVVAPWSWELTARENPAYPASGESCYFIGGAKGSLALPNIALWQNPKERGWWQPITATRMPFDFTGDSMLQQIMHFAAVIRGEVPPLVSGEDGLRALAVIEAAKESAANGGDEVSIAGKIDTILQTATTKERQ